MLKSKFYKRISQESPFPYFRVILILLLAVSLALVYVWQRISVIKSAQEIQDLKNQMGRCKEEYKYLSLDVAQIGSAENIQKIAESKLDLLPADHRQIVFMSDPKTSDPIKRENFLLKARKTVRKVIPLSETKVEAKEVKDDL